MDDDSERHVGKARHGEQGSQDKDDGTRHEYRRRKIRKRRKNAQGKERIEESHHVRHRKRHLLPGPAGALCCRTMDAGHGKQNGSKEDSDPKQAETQQSMTQRGDDFCFYMEDEGREKNTRKRKRHRQNRPSPSRSEGVGGRAWDSMCISLKRHVPEHYSLRQIATTDDPVHDYYAVFARPCVSSIFTLAYEILTPYSMAFDRLVVPRIVLAICAVHCHDHCDWTVELRDETNSNASVPVLPQPPPLIGWVEDSFRRQYPHWIRPGAVILCQNVPVAVFPSSQTTPSAILDDSSDDEDDSEAGRHDDKDDEERQKREVLQEDANGEHQGPKPPESFPAFHRDDDIFPADRYSTHLEKMLLLGEQSVTFVWTPEQNQHHDDEKDYRMYLHLLQERATAEQSCLGNAPQPPERRSILASARKKQRRRPRQSQGSKSANATTTTKTASPSAEAPSKGLPVNPYKQKKSSTSSPAPNTQKAEPSIEESWEEHLENSRLPPGIQQVKSKITSSESPSPKPPQSQPEAKQSFARDQKHKSVTAGMKTTTTPARLTSPKNPFSDSTNNVVNPPNQSRDPKISNPDKNKVNAMTTSTSPERQPEGSRLADATRKHSKSLLMWTNPLLDTYGKKNLAGWDMWAGLDSHDDDDSSVELCVPSSSKEQSNVFDCQWSTFEGIFSLEDLDVSEKEESAGD